MKIGKPVATRATPAPKLTKDEQKAFMARAQELTPRYAAEPLLPDSGRCPGQSECFRQCVAEAVAIGATYAKAPMFLQ